MKKRVLSKLLLAMITASLLFSGCGAEETDGNVESSQVEAEQESTEQVEKEIVDASFTWNVSDQDLYVVKCRGLEVKPSWFLGTVTYSDGTVGSIDADEVELKQEGNKLKVYINFRGNDSVGYEIEIPEIWEDMNLNEQSQEEVEQWYEGLGGDSSKIDSSATEVHDDWNVDVVDASDWEFNTQVMNMIQLLEIWEGSLSEESVSDYNSAQQAHFIIGNEGACDPEYVKEYKEYPLEGKDYYLNATYKEGSEWQLRYGDASITEVFTEAGLDYGVPCVCYCTYKDDYKYGFEQAISDYFDMGYERGSKDMFWLSHAVEKIPLSEHNVRQLSMEEVREYILAVYMYYGDEISVHTEDGLEYYEEPHILKLYGVDVDTLIQKFGKYFSYTPDVKTIYTVYELAMDKGYSGSVIDFYKLEGKELDDIMLELIIDECESMDWQLTNGDLIGIIESLGGTVPDYATVVEESTEFTPSGTEGITIKH